MTAAQELQPILDNGEKRWPWSAEVRPKVVIKSLDRAPSLDVLYDVEPEKDWHRFVQQMDYRAIDQAVFDHAAAVLIAVADGLDHGLRVGVACLGLRTVERQIVVGRGERGPIW